MKQKLIILLGPLLLMAFLQPAIASSVKVAAHSNKALEGNDIRIYFSMQRNTAPYRTSWRTCYSYKTVDGTATASGPGSDYDSASGVVCWNQHTSNSEIVTIKTRPDRICEPNETVKIKLYNPRSSTRIGWTDACGPWPCHITAKATIKQDNSRVKACAY